MEKRKDKKSNSGHSEAAMEDYGDYVTRCICDFQHDDGYMICCDGCGVWQHIECMQVDTKNLPENYLCEECDPRPVDRKRARQAQIKKREDISDLEDDEDSPPGRKGLTMATPSGSGMKKKRKRGKSTEIKPEQTPIKSGKNKKDAPLSSSSSSVKKSKKKPVVGKGQSQGQGKVGSIQSLLNAASLLESVGGVSVEATPTSGRNREHHRSTDIWNANLSPWSDKYDSIDHNRYSEPIRSFISSHLSQLKSEAVVYSQDEYLTWDQRSQPQCEVTEVGRRRKGLVANGNIPEDELVIEYMGKITAKQLVVNEIAPESKSLWQHKPCPFVYCYDKIAGVDMCIDARNSGTIARFMRRSCSPNSEIRHFFVSSELHFGVYALNSIAEGEEITLPFDFKFDKCEYMMECACGQPWTMCLVARTPRRHTAAKSNTSSEQSGSRGPSRQQSLSHLSAGDEDSNSSWLSSSGKKRSRHHQGGSGHGPHKTSQQTSLECTSDSDDEASAAREKEKRRKSLSREERKTEQVWKLVEKMEASQQRKQRQQLLSEGSMESDPLGSPSHQPTTPHLFTSYKATPTSVGGKDKKGSGGSRKPHIYPATKMRLSSVSSTDPLSPCELSEAFSPPFTPGLATGPDVALTPSHTHSPLVSPPPTVSTHKPTFIVTPDLHPKYLFADFALPYKKAFLKQWEDEQRNQNGHTHPYWPVGSTLSAYHLTEEQTRRRIRGSLKHRWLKQHREEKERERLSNVAMETSDGVKAPLSSDEHDKENLHTVAPVSHKKLLLMRWEKAAIDKASLPLSPPPSPHTSQPHTLTEGKLTKDRDSPLFEELSDEEFEDARKPADEAIEKGLEGPKTPPLPEVMDSVSLPLHSAGQTSATQAKGEKDDDDDVDLNLSSVSDTSLASNDDEEEEGTGPKTPPTEPSEPTLINLSDISSDMDNDNDNEQLVSGELEEVSANQAERTGGKSHQLETTGVVVNQPEIDEEAPGNQPVVAKETTREEESLHLAGSRGVEEVTKSADGAELSTPETATTSLESTAVVPMEDMAHPQLAEVLSQQESAPPSPTAVGTPTKTPGKRKINLSEYRNRARKPAERKVTSEKSSPPQTTSSSSLSLLSTPSFLSQSIASRILLSSPSLSSYQSSSLKLSSTAGTLGGVSSLSGQVGVSSGSAPQFEPVSPDDVDDGTPTNSGDPPSSATGAVGDLSMIHSLPQQPQQFVTVPAPPGFTGAQTILGPADHPPPAPVQQMMVGPGGPFLQPPPGQPQQASLVHMVPQGGVLQAPPLPPPGGQYGMWPAVSGAPVGESALDPRKGLIPIPGPPVVQQAVPQHGLYPVHTGPLIQPGLIQHAGDLGPMMPHGRGRGEFHHHGFVGHPPPPPSAPVYRPRPPGPGGSYY